MRERRAAFLALLTFVPLTSLLVGIAGTMELGHVLAKAKRSCRRCDGGQFGT